MSVAIQFTQNFLGVEPECSQVCKFVKEFRPDLLGVCTARIEVPCKLVEVEFDRPTPLQIDGETILGVTSYKVKAWSLDQK